MKNNSIDEVIQKSFMAQINTGELLFLFIMATVSGVLFARLFKKQYSPRTLIKSYLFYGIVHFLIGIAFFKLPISIVAGTYLLGAIVAAFRSNYYFYE